MTWGTPRSCVRCGEPGPRVVWLGGYVHYYCLSLEEQRERRQAHDDGRKR